MCLLRRIAMLISTGILALGPGACNVRTPVITQAPAPAASATPQATASATATESPSPTPLLPSVLLLSPEGSDPGLTGSIQELLASLAEQEGLLFEDVSTISAGDLPQDGLQVIVVLPPDPGLAALVAAAPETQFLAVNIPGLEPAPNLSQIHAQGVRPEQSAFLAGYLAAAITQDWRTGVISLAGEASSRVGFTNGVYYFCGLCRPAYPPFPNPGYPLSAELPAGAGEADWQNAVAHFQTWGVQSVYVDQAVASEGLLNTLGGAGFNLISAGPPPAGLGEHWIASIGSGDLSDAVQQVWPELISGRGGASIELSLVIRDINEDLFSVGRQRLVEQIRSDLAAGYIDTGVEPTMTE
jgi:hypothetical protein